MRGSLQRGGAAASADLSATLITSSSLSLTDTPKGRRLGADLSPASNNVAAVPWQGRRRLSAAVNAAAAARQGAPSGARSGGGGACYLYTLTALSAVGGFLFGYDTGVISGAMLLLVQEFEFTNREQEQIVSVTLVGCILAALCSSCLTERLGRKPAVLLGSLVFAAGAVVMAVADGLHLLLVGRFIVGLAVGLASMVVPLFIAEAAPPSQRGALVTVNNVFVTGGQFFACVVSALLSKVDYPHGWRFMLGAGALPAVVQFVGFLCMPESPRWLAKYRGEDAARAVLRRIRGTAEVEAELEAITASIEADGRSASTGLVEALRSPPLRRAMALGCSASSKLC